MIQHNTLQEIEGQLINGFHDARLHEFSVCLSKNEVKFHLEVFVGDPDANGEEEKERYRHATLQIQDLCYFVIDPPADTVNFPTHASRIDGGVADETSPETRPRRSIPDDAFAYWFYVQDCNWFIHFAAKIALFQWD